MSKRHADVDDRVGPNEISDGFGSIWSKCPGVKSCGLQVVRPGKVQCWCDGVEMPAADVEQLALSMGDTDVEKVAFIVGRAEANIRENGL